MQVRKQKYMMAVVLQSANVLVKMESQGLSCDTRTRHLVTIARELAKLLYSHNTCARALYVQAN